MPNMELRNAIFQLVKDMSEAHQKEFASSQGVDPDWPIWYAERMQQPLEKIADMHFSKSRLIYCLMNADYEHEARSPDTDWAEYTAERFIECYGISETPTEDKLALYYMPTCPYCIRVLRAIGRLGLDIELRNISENRTFRDELITARGRATVPVLRIDSPKDNERWMPESLDIIAYLERTYSTE